MEKNTCTVRDKLNRKEKIKFNDWKYSENYTDHKGYVFKFHLKNGYHHVDINLAFLG